MKLLLDENLSPTLTGLLSETYPGTAHVRDLGLKSSPDTAVWSYAANHNYTIVTKDADFHHRSFLSGQPPKIVWIRLGNCSTRQILQLLTGKKEQVEAFLESEEQSFLVLA